MRQSPVGQVGKAQRGCTCPGPQLGCLKWLRAGQASLPCYLYVALQVNRLASLDSLGGASGLHREGRGAGSPNAQGGSQRNRSRKYDTLPLNVSVENKSHSFTYSLICSIKERTYYVQATVPGTGDTVENKPDKVCYLGFTNCQERRH